MSRHLIRLAFTTRVTPMPAAQRRYRLGLLLIWFGAIGLGLFLNRQSIADFRFWDPDDVMRLLEVRDWLGGQTWFDVTQYRMNRPAGLSMHWSRLVDVPLAGLILLFQPIFGQRAAETIAATAVPLATLGATMALTGGIARRLHGIEAGLLAAALCLVSIGTWYAMQPMRIDHHGWQIVAGLGMALALVSRPDRRGAALAGLCAALWTHVSLEGLAFTMGAAGWLAVAWICRAERRTELPSFLAALFAASAALHLATRGTFILQATFCDQISPVHISTFGLAALVSIGLTAAYPRSRPGRTVAIALLAISCAGLYAFWAPQCRAGPFATLGPLGYNLWYRSVHEGIPLWQAGSDTLLLWGIFPWLGFVGATATWLRSGNRGWPALTYCILLGWANLIALLVTRAGAFANLLALPGAACLVMLAFERSEGWSMPARILSRALALILLSPIGTEFLPPMIKADNSPPPGIRIDPRCGLIDTLRPLDRFARTTVIGPLELGPNLVAATHHDAVTGPYHRDPSALEDVLRFFIASDPRNIAVRRHATLLAFCPGRNEMSAMAKFAPGGLAAQILNGRPPNWLHPVFLPGTAGLRVYRLSP
ncbi:MAG TPA: hypothetical protein VNT42_09465 [Sphingomonas sp.]|nr:hypothetical protein [Sphingomonas sp.]